MPASVDLRWNSDRVITRARATMLARGNLAAQAVEQQVKARVGAPSPPASLPGQPPHRTKRGALQRSIVGAARLLTNRIRIAITVSAQVGDWNLGRLLQRGTRRMAARPFIGFPVDHRLIADILSGRRKL